MFHGLIEITSTSMPTKRPFWESLLIGMFHGLIFAVFLTVVEIYTENNLVFSWSKAIFCFFAFSIFQTFSNRWKIKKN